LQASGLFREGLAQKSRHLLAVYCYQQRLLSLGKAARLAELNRWDFIDLLAEQNVPVLNYSDDELAAEFAAVDQLDQALDE
jgi:predicted HTH domain antitoxin